MVHKVVSKRLVCDWMQHWRRSAERLIITSKWRLEWRMIVELIRIKVDPHWRIEHRRLIIEERWLIHHRMRWPIHHHRRLVHPVAAATIAEAHS